MADAPIHIVLNPAAGGGVDEPELDRWLDEHRDAVVHRTEGAGDGRRLAGEAAAAGASLVVAAGGDGTIREVVQGLLELARDRRPRLAIVPLGSANDLSRALGLAADPGEALRVLDEGEFRRMDAIACELDGDRHYCVNVVVGGFGAQLHDALDDEAKDFWGPLAYLRGGIESWSEMEPYTVSLRMDGDPEELEALNLVIANGSRAGWGLPVAPYADPFDGRLDVVAIRDAPGQELAKLAAAFMKGDPDSGQHEALVYRQVREVTVRAEASIPLSLDGEQHRARESSYEVIEGAIEIVVPEAPAL